MPNTFGTPVLDAEKLPLILRTSAQGWRPAEVSALRIKAGADSVFCPAEFAADARGGAVSAFCAPTNGVAPEVIGTLIS